MPRGVTMRRLLIGGTLLAVAACGAGDAAPAADPLPAAAPADSVPAPVEPGDSVMLRDTIRPD